MNPATLSMMDRSTTGPGSTILPIKFLDVLQGESADIFEMFAIGSNKV